MYCSKKIEVLKNGRMKQHIVHKGTLCIGSGQNAEQMQLQIELITKCRKEKTDK